MCLNCSFLQGFQWSMTKLATPLDRRRFLCSSLAASAVLAPGVRPMPALAQKGLGDRSGPATVVFRSGKVYTVDPDQPWAEAVAVRGKAIAAVGTNAAVEKLIGPDTRVIELNGRMMLPGFVEAHIHPTLGAFLTGGVDLQVDSREDALAAIARYAAENPGQSVRGFGWRADMFPPEGPDKADLDRIVPDRPAYFINIDAHSLWLNSKALEVAGITRDTPDPMPGFSYFARDAKGEPTGFVLEIPAMMAVMQEIEPITVDAMSRCLQAWMPKAAAAGITCVFDAGVVPIDGDQVTTLEIYPALEEKGLLPFRVVASYMIKNPPITDAWRQAVELRQRINTELVQAGVLKIVGDGTAEGYTAVLLEPYADKPETIVRPPFSREEFETLVIEADAAGLDVHVHAFGDATARLALDAFEAAIRTNPQRDRRHSIAHLVYVSDADIPRFGRLDAVAQFSANWFSADPDTAGTLLERLGPERQRRMCRPRSVLDAGGRISFGTDWPAAGYFSTYKPLDAIQVAVTRQLIGKPDAPVLDPVDERLDLAQAIYANTLGGAYQLRMEDRIGSITAGKLADLVVLEKNLFEVAKRDIAKVRIDMTMMNGRFTHGEPA